MATPSTPWRSTKGMASASHLLPPLPAPADNAGMFIHDGYFTVDPAALAIVAGAMVAIAACVFVVRRRNR